jgi:TolB-like protein/Tfp pilus assembly protein PilF
MSTESTELRKLAAIMFTDMVGYTALTHANEALALDLLEEHRRLLRTIFPRHAGREIETTGDGFLVEFASALEATRCAIAIQKAIANYNVRAVSQRRFAVRIGIHVGDVVSRDGHVLGAGVNVAARLEPLASPGGICITQQVFDQIRHLIKEAVTSLGRFQLKNVPQPVEVYRVEASLGAIGLTPAAARADQRSVAVLPFVNMSSDRENEFLSDGITEDLISALSQVKGLRVPARTSSFAFKGKNEDIRRIGQLLNVSTVLEGSVRKSGNKLRVTAQLAKVEDGFHLWSDKYDREMKDVFDIQDDITRAIMQALKVRLSGVPEVPLVKRHTENTEAYQHYLKGRDLWSARGLGLKKALHYFELALLEDLNYALAYTGLADAYNLLGFYGFLRPHIANEKARLAAHRALEIDPALAESHTSMGVVQVFDWSWAAAEQEYLQAIQLNPNYVPARYWHALYYSAQCRHLEAIEQIRQALEVDPLSFLLNAIEGWIWLHAHQFDRAIEQLQRAVEIKPDFVFTHWLFGQACLAGSRSREAIDAFKRAAELSGNAAWAVASVAHGHAAAGEKERAGELLAELQVRSRQDYVSSWFLALVYAALGERDQVFAMLERAHEEGDMHLLWTKCHFAFDRFHDDSRYAGILHKIRLDG